MIRPLYRWKSFWFGVLVLAFLGWAWAASLTRGNEVRFHQGGSYVTLRTIAGSAVFSRSLNGSGEMGFRTGRFGVVSKGWSLPSAMSWKPRDAGWALVLGYWFLILLFLVPWSGWLAWRWRRIRRAEAHR